VTCVQKLSYDVRCEEKNVGDSKHLILSLLLYFIPKWVLVKKNHGRLHIDGRVRSGSRFCGA